MNGLRGYSMAVVLVLAATGVGASTLMPTDVAGGYSSSVSAPTEVGAGVTGVSGSVSGQKVMAFVLNALPSGAQKISFDFTLPMAVQGASNGYAFGNFGGVVRYSVGTPFAGNVWTGGKEIGFGLDNTSDASRRKTVSIDLGDDFSGPLYVGMVFTYGQAAGTFAIDVPSNAAAPTLSAPAPSTVPVPAGAALLLSAIAGLGALRARRRKA